MPSAKLVYGMPLSLPGQFLSTPELLLSEFLDKRLEDLVIKKNNAIKTSIFSTFLGNDIALPQRQRPHLEPRISETIL